MNAIALSARLRESTKAMHRLAERSAFMGGLLAGRLPREGYCDYLRNLHALYDALERELDRLSGDTPHPPWILPSIFRRDAIASDLVHLAGPDWPALPVTRTIETYAARMATVARESPHRLAAHAYVRYLGDLSGGQAIRGVIRRAYALDGERGTAFYDFRGAGDVDVLKSRLRTAFDADGETLGPARCEEIAGEAVDAFARHRALFDELREATAAN